MKRFAIFMLVGPAVGFPVVLLRQLLTGRFAGWEAVAYQLPFAYVFAVLPSLVMLLVDWLLFERLTPLAKDRDSGVGRLWGEHRHAADLVAQSAPSVAIVDLWDRWSRAGSHLLMVDERRRTGLAVDEAAIGRAGRARAVNIGRDGRGARVRHSARHRRDHRRKGAALPDATYPARCRNPCGIGNRARARRGLNRRRGRCWSATAIPLAGRAPARPENSAPPRSAASRLSASASERTNGTGAETTKVSKPIEGACSSAARCASAASSTVRRRCRNSFAFRFGPDMARCVSSRSGKKRAVRRITQFKP